jgi:hypothetical protein
MQRYTLEISTDTNRYLVTKVYSQIKQLSELVHFESYLSSSKDMVSPICNSPPAKFSLVVKSRIVRPSSRK